MTVPAGPIIAVALAGGTGSRVGAELPKQFLTLGGVSLLVRSCRTLASVSDELIVVMHADHVGRAVDELAAADIDATVVVGGSTRSASTRSALDAIAAESGKIIVHDVARPLVGEHTFAECIGALDHRDAVTVAQPVTDTIARRDGDVVAGYIPRAELVRVQTPQAFSLAVLRAAHASAGEFTDDCQAVSALDPELEVGIIAGAERNMKITGPDDLALAESLLERL